MLREPSRHFLDSYAIRHLILNAPASKQVRVEVRRLAQRSTRRGPTGSPPGSRVVLRPPALRPNQPYHTAPSSDAFGADAGAQQVRAAHVCHRPQRRGLHPHLHHDRRGTHTDTLTVKTWTSATRAGLLAFIAPPSPHPFAPDIGPCCSLLPSNRHRRRSRSSAPPRAQWRQPLSLLTRPPRPRRLRWSPCGGSAACAASRSSGLAARSQWGPARSYRLSRLWRRSWRHCSE